MASDEGPVDFSSPSTHKENLRLAQLGGIAPPVYQPSQVLENIGGLVEVAKSRLTALCLRMTPALILGISAAAMGYMVSRESLSLSYDQAVIPVALAAVLGIGAGYKLGLGLESRFLRSVSNGR